MLVTLISTYELGRQPFGLASPAAWLRRAGLEVACCDLAVAALDEEAVARAGVIGLYLPMHTATRLALALIPRLRRLNPTATLCAYGLYGPMNADILGELGVTQIIGGEFEAALTEVCRAVAAGAPPPAAVAAPLGRLPLVAPERAGLPPLSTYAGILIDGERRTAGYTEATRGCKHTCRHCPIVPVYGGRFRAVPREAVLEDVRRQVAAGAGHITFGDPDFLNGPGHALALVRAIHTEHPTLTYDVTVKVEHLLAHAGLLPELRATGCALVTSAFESFDDRALALLDKGHTRADIERAVGLARAAGLALNPTFVAFGPWTSRADYVAFLAAIADLDLVEAVSPVQYAIRLLLPRGSRLLELPEVAGLAGPFDPAALCHPWAHPDPAMDVLQRAVEALAADGAATGAGRGAFFRQVWALASDEPPPALEHRIPRPPIPLMTEPWYC